jgi:hypothetical protein
VEAQIARADPNPGLAADAAGDAQHLQLAVAVEAIARLDLDGGDAGRLQPFETTEGRGVEVVLGRLARGLDRGDDAAAGAGDLLIGRALQTLFELAGTVAAEDEVGVAIDQARRDPAAAEAVGLRRLVVRQVGARADPDDGPVADQDRRVLDCAIGDAALGSGGHGGDVAVGDQQIGLHGRSPRAGEKRATRS